MEMKMEIPSVKASANSDVMYFFTSAQDGDPSQDDARLCLGDDLKKAQDHNVINLVRYIDKYRLIEVYIEHEYTVLDTYLKSLQKLRLEEIVDVESSALAKKPGLKVNRLPQLLLEGPSLNDEGSSLNAEFNECNEEDNNEDELLGLDGCFMKGQYPGQLLTAVGIDANHGYPAALHKFSLMLSIGRAHCDVLLNNLCEVFNGQLVDGRDVPIITCLEFIREYLMKRIVNVKKVISKSVVAYGGSIYKQPGPFEDQCVVDIEEKKCSYRKWELTGMPCKHAVAVINEMATTNADAGVPESWVHSSYWDSNVGGSQGSNVGGSQGSKVVGSQASKVGGSQAAKRARGSQTGL
ncbi:mutator type transposase [Tanacetum coccineum]